MMATLEFDRTRTLNGEPARVWHLMADPAACRGECDFHAIVCGTEDDGIALPGTTRDVPLDLESAAGERWCGDCLAAAQDQ